MFYVKTMENWKTTSKTGITRDLFKLVDPLIARPPISIYLYNFATLTKCIKLIG